MQRSINMFVKAEQDYLLALFTVEPFHPDLQKLTVLSGFQRKQKDLYIDRDCWAQMGGITYIYWWLWPVETLILKLLLEYS